MRDLPDLTTVLLDRIRARRPRVHCITNAVAQTFSANMLLAAGAVPSMTISADEIGAFVSRADALLVNLGTFDAERRQAVEIALAAAADKNVPWLLDPVFIDRSPPRADYARALIGKKPRAIRLNQAEFTTLAGCAADRATLARYAGETGAVIGLTGETDFVTDAARFVTIANGDALMARVTAMGCAGSALAAAFLAVEDDAFVAVAAALLVLGVAGEIAAHEVRGPGRFAAAILDVLYRIDRDAIVTHAKVSE